MINFEYLEKRIQEVFKMPILCTKNTVTRACMEVEFFPREEEKPLQIGQKVMIFSKDDVWIDEIKHISKTSIDIYFPDGKGLFNFVSFNPDTFIDSSGKYFFRTFDKLDKKEIENEKRRLWSGESGVLNQNRCIL